MTLEKEQDGAEEEKNKPMDESYKSTRPALLNECTRFDDDVPKTQPPFALAGGPGRPDLVGFQRSVRLSRLRQWSVEG